MKTTFEFEASSDPDVHSQHVQEQLRELIDHLRKDVERVTEPRFQALLETSAEVLTGIRTAFEHYDKHEEKAWQQ
jgi:hypothetical protein